MSDATTATRGTVNANHQFRLLGKGGPITARGISHSLPTGNMATIEKRVGTFFENSVDGPGYLVGAVPFDRMADDYLYQPSTFERISSTSLPPVHAGPDPNKGNGGVLAEPASDAYAEAVRRSLQMMADSISDPEPLMKVVLSRSLQFGANGTINMAAILARLAQDPSVTAFATPLPSAGSRWLVGATPELLVSRRGRTVVSHPLAGSARRYADPVSDRQSAEALSRSDKDRNEHRVVVEAIMDALSPLCNELAIWEGEARLTATASMWHLGTRIAGILKDPDVPVSRLLAELHPTPAVCGLPRWKAADAIRVLEGYQRDFYAGAVGWMNRAGDGEWYVSIRCAEISEQRLRLFAGAGIVPGSDADAETDETSAKFQAMLSALGIDESGRRVREDAA